jgi:hypothetical protein
MSYLAMSAATLDDNNNNHNHPTNQSYDTTSIYRKRQAHNKTQKYRQSSDDLNKHKVNAVLQSIHNTTPDDDNLGNYNPQGTAETAKHSEQFKPLNPYDFPAKPMSMGGDRKEGMANYNTVPQPVDNDDLQLQELQSAYMNEGQVRDYYRKLSPSYKHVDTNTHTNAHTNTNTNTTGNQVLIDKLNYMINLLEEQQDQKTGSVMEEIILYSFLGVFIIFVVDGFTKIGKYKR